MKHLLLSSAVLILLASCANLNDITLTGISDIRFQGIEKNTVNFSASVGVHNPASLGFTLREINLKTSIEGHYIGTLIHNRPLHIPARSDSSYHMNFSLELTNMLTGASMLYGLAKKSKVALDLQGYVKTRSFLIPKKTGIQENRVVEIPSNFR